ncbi:unnamed protein product [Strongylus vulgaris]|uniref:Uncharacterized protein n=1 Tax=Strongylus vulgaris TaxID=40348 RepID=A0A3P7JZB8_STRVU|nr:unnamed protein product [Strongylus vulgaris]
MSDTECVMEQAIIGEAAKDALCSSSEPPDPDRSAEPPQDDSSVSDETQKCWFEVFGNCYPSI